MLALFSLSSQPVTSCLLASRKCCVDRLRPPFFGATHAAIASSLSQIVTSPRLLRPRSYSLQFRILYFFLYWRLTRLDFAATTTLPPRSP